MKTENAKAEWEDGIKSALSPEVLIPLRAVIRQCGNIQVQHPCPDICPLILLLALKKNLYLSLLLLLLRSLFLQCFRLQ